MEWFKLQWNQSCTHTHIITMPNIFINGYGKGSLFRLRLGGCSGSDWGWKQLVSFDWTVACTVHCSQATNSSVLVASDVWLFTSRNGRSYILKAFHCFPEILLSWWIGLHIFRETEQDHHLLQTGPHSQLDKYLSLLFNSMYVFMSTIQEIICIM